MPCSEKTSSNNLIVVAVSILSKLLTTTKCEKWSNMIRYFWAFHSKLSMLSAFHGLLVARSLIKGLAQFFFATYFIQAGHANIISLMSLVKPGQKTDCLARYRVLFTLSLNSSYVSPMTSMSSAILNTPSKPCNSHADIVQKDHWHLLSPL